MIYGGGFAVGVIALGLASIWGIAAWLCSETLANKKPQRPRKAKPAQIERYRNELERYFLRKFSIPVAIVAVPLVTAAFVANKRQTELLNRLQGALYPADDPESSQEGEVALYIGTSGNGVTTAAFPATIFEAGK